MAAIAEIASERVPFATVILNEHDSHLDRVLALDAIMHYTRSTEHHRGSGIDIKRAFNEKQRADHRSIVDLRNKEIAHHEGVFGNWTDEHLVAVRNPGVLEFKVIPAFRRANFKGDDLRNLELLSRLLIIHAYDEYTQKRLTLEETLSTSWTKLFDDDFAESLRKSFIGDDEAAAKPDNFEKFPLNYVRFARSAPTQ